jgi:separase
VVANLWDVTDRDIDRFAARVLQKWSGAAAGDCAAAGDDALTDRDTGSGLVDVSAAISASRGACRLPALVGSAVVCCGLPASVQIA